MRHRSLAPLFLLLAAPALAADASPGTVTLRSAKQGDVHLRHDTHAALECSTCHREAEPGKMAPMSQRQAHALCLDCHKRGEAERAPQKCEGCHHRKDRSRAR